MNKKKELGKVLKNVQGYSIRLIIDKKSTKDDGYVKLDTGKLGVYAGKNLKQGGLNSLREAETYINEKLLLLKKKK